MDPERDAPTSVPEHPEHYASAHIANVASAVRELRHPTQVGPYSVQQLIGEGGMGSVYRAEQREPIHRTVALKLVKLGMDTREVIARFESERQALAMMDHPNVARVLDAGATDTGRPYFVMEFVAGEPITKFADRHRMTVRDRLALFTQACDAVQHAHQKAIIHRDLKPSNILVSQVNDKPLVKVIDFGVAKALSQRLTEKTLFTQTGQLVGTPEYMAPEQADPATMDVDTRADVYSLGVVLYELLSGSLPFDPGTLRGAEYGEIQRIIRETDPPRPSTRLSKLGDRATEVARLRRTQLEALERQLQRELEWIPLKAMQKERGRRYSSATELAEDINNYLAARPLRAAPDSIGYRARKFFRRNKASVIVAMSMLLLLLLGIVATSWQAVRATRAEAKTRVALAEIDRQRKQAEDARAAAQAVNEFLTEDMLGAADPTRTRGRQVTVFEALDAAARTVGQKFRDRPLEDAAVRATVASTYDALGEPALARPHAQAAYDTRRRMLGDDHPDTIVAAVQLARVLESEGDYDAAYNLAAPALDRARRILGTRDERTLNTMGAVAAILHRQSKLADAERLYRESVEGSRSLYGDRHPQMLIDEHNLAYLLYDRGRFDEAILMFRRVLAVGREVNGADHVDTINAKTNLARALMETGELDEAALLSQEALDANRRVLKDEHPRTLQSMRNLAMTLDRAGRREEAEQMFREALALTRRLQGDDHPETMSALSQLAGVLKRKGDLAGSLELHSESLERCRRVLGDDHVYTLFAINNVGQTLLWMEKPDQAEPFFAEAYRRAPNTQMDPKLQAVMMSRWGTCLVLLGRYSEAESPLRDALQRLRDTEQSGTTITGNVLSALARVCEETGRTEEANELRAAAAAAGPAAPATTPATAPATAPATSQTSSPAVPASR